MFQLDTEIYIVFNKVVSFTTSITYRSFKFRISINGTNILNINTNSNNTLYASLLDRDAIFFADFTSDNAYLSDLSYETIKTLDSFNKYGSTATINMGYFSKTHLFYKINYAIYVYDIINGKNIENVNTSQNYIVGSRNGYLWRYTQSPWVLTLDNTNVDGSLKNVFILFPIPILKDFYFAMGNDYGVANILSEIKNRCVVRGKIAKLAGIVD